MPNTNWSCFVTREEQCDMTSSLSPTKILTINCLEDKSTKMIESSSVVSYAVVFLLELGLTDYFLNSTPTLVKVRCSQYSTFDGQQKYVYVLSKREKHSWTTTFLI